MNEKTSRRDEQSPGNAGNWDTGTHAAFYDYYQDKSLSPQTLERFERIRDLLLRLIGPDAANGGLDVADVGCGAGSEAWLWARLNHRVFGLDVISACAHIWRRSDSAAWTDSMQWILRAKA